MKIGFEQIHDVLLPGRLTDQVQQAIAADVRSRILDASPLKRRIYDLGMRLGEGSGAAIAISLVEQALALYDGMATFAEAAVSNRGS